MNIKVLIDIDNLTATSTDPEVVIVDVLNEDGKILVEISKPDPEMPMTQVPQIP